MRFQFQPGNTFSKGRAVGARNRLSRTFLETLEASFAKHGEKAMEVEWIEHHLEMLKLVAALEARQIRYEGAASGMSDEQLEAVERVLIDAQAQVALPSPQEPLQRIRVIGVAPHEETPRPNRS